MHNNIKSDTNAKLILLYITKHVQIMKILNVRGDMIIKIHLIIQLKILKKNS